MALTEASLIQCIRENSGPNCDVDGESPLFSSGMLDSFAMLNLIMFVEAQTGMDVRAEDVTLENFDTARRILDFASRVTA